MNHHTGQIDGPGMTIEIDIDESTFGKMKFNRGRCIEGQWVFGGICRQTKACFHVPVGQRDRLKIHSYPSFEPTYRRVLAR